jgi:class 3 adenylate cyclase
MKLKKFEDYIIKEAVGGEETPKRSERILTQAQRNHEESLETNGEGSSPIMPTMVFTDVVESSKQWSYDPHTMFINLEEHHKLVDALSKKYNGWIVKTIGDAFMVYFNPSKDSFTNALKFCKDVILMEKKYKLRVGICHGNMEEKTYTIQGVSLRDFFGNAVNMASRMESKLSPQNGIAFSSTKPISPSTVKDIQDNILGSELTSVENLDLNGVIVNKAYKAVIK